MSKQLIPVFIAGLLSSSLYLVIFSLGLGFLFMFLPTLPLLLLGLSTQSRQVLIASLVAAAIVMSVTNMAAALLFLLFLALPSWLIVQKSLLWRTSADGQKQWFPIGVIMIDLTLYACIAIALITLYYVDEPGGLPQILAHNIQEEFADLKTEYGDIIDSMASGWSFLVFSITIWLWGMALYGHAWVANRTLIRHHKSLRPDFAVVPFTLPSWILTLLLITALASLIGSESMRFWGKSTMISLLLPYFFLGVALIHEACKTWPNRRFLLFFLYFMVFTQFWPSLLVAGAGLWHQIKTLNKHLSGSGTSSRN